MRNHRLDLGKDVTSRESPKVVGHSPESGATDVGLDTEISVEFSTEMNPTSLNHNTFMVYGRGNVVAGNFDYKDRELTFKPDTRLEPDTKHFVLLAGDYSTHDFDKTMVDADGNPLAANYTFEFTTSDTRPISAPRITEPQAMSVTSESNIRWECDVEGDVSYQVQVSGDKLFRSVDYDQLTLSQEVRPQLDPHREYWCRVRAVAERETEEDYDQTQTIRLTVPTGEAGESTETVTSEWSSVVQFYYEPPSVEAEEPEEELEFETPDRLEELGSDKEFVFRVNRRLTPAQVVEYVDVELVGRSACETALHEDHGEINVWPMFVGYRDGYTLIQIVDFEPEPDHAHATKSFATTRDVATHEASFTTPPDSATDGSTFTTPPDSATAESVLETEKDQASDVGEFTTEAE